MSRIPKFKCFVAATKKMLLLESTTEAHNHYLQTGSGGWWLYSSATGALVASSEAGDILLQFTDLPDKNGKEIYEGDIVRVDEKVMLVQMLEGCWRTKYGTFTNYRLYGWVEGSLEVIGNIYENADLIKAQPID